MIHGDIRDHGSNEKGRSGEMRERQHPTDLSFVVRLCPSTYSHLQGESSVVHGHKFELGDECKTQMTHRRG